MPCKALARPWAAEAGLELLDILNTGETGLPSPIRIGSPFGKRH